MKTLYTGGPIYTMEREGERVEALLVQNGVIQALGKQAEVEALADDNTRRIDLKGYTLIPAFLDAHSHFFAAANSFLQVSLEETKSFDDILCALEKHQKENHLPKGSWIFARGYDHNALLEKKHPSLALLDQACPDHPVVLQHASGHMGVFNSRALQELSVGEDIADIPGGMIQKEHGRLTGYMEENAFLHYLKKAPMPSLEQILQACQKAQEWYLSYGITTVQEGMLTKELVPLYQGLLQSGLLQIDLVGYLDQKDQEALLSAFPQHRGIYHRHFKVGGCKIFLDGSPQGKTAWMRTPYVDSQDCGYPILTDEEVESALLQTISARMQLLAHCNGDAASAQYLRVVRKVEQTHPLLLSLRPVMIHAQLLGLDQMADVKETGILPSFFVAHVYHWGDVHIQNFGYARAASISPVRAAEKEEIPYTFHQDTPVIPPNMMETVWCAVTRQTKQGIVLGEDQKVSVYAALQAVTGNAAYQYFEEDAKGSLRVGKHADFVILDQDPFEVSPQNLKFIQVLQTIKNDQTLFLRENRA